MKDKRKKTGFDEGVILDDVTLEDIGFAQLLMRAVDRIHKLTAMGYPIAAPVNALKMMMSPYFDDKYNSEIKNVEVKYKKEKQDARRKKLATGRIMKTAPIEMYTHELFGALIKLMSRKSLLLKNTIMEEVL